MICCICKTEGVISNNCDKRPDFVYIGETGRTTTQRFSEQRGDATQIDEIKPCAKHFSLPGHSGKTQ